MQRNKRFGINRILNSSHPPKPNLSKVKYKAIQIFKKDRSKIILTVD